MRLTFNDSEIEQLLDILFAARTDEAKILINLIDRQRSDLYSNPEAMRNKRTAMAKATAVREDKAKRKIESALNMMRLLGVKINKSQLAEKAKVSRVTLNKYWKDSWANK